MRHRPGTSETQMQPHRKFNNNPCPRCIDTLTGMHPDINQGDTYCSLQNGEEAVYAPREYSEVCTVMRIIEAGAKFLESIDGESL